MPMFSKQGAINDNDPTLDEDIGFIFPHGCGRFIHVEAYSCEFTEDDELYYDYSGELIFPADAPLTNIQCRVEDALGWHGQLVVSWIQ
jgi:hypothetical protein